MRPVIRGSLSLVGVVFLLFLLAAWVAVSRGGSPALAGPVPDKLDVPATYYGPVLAGPGFTPTVGVTVTAWITHNLCGQSQTLESAGEVVYAIDVQGLGPGGADVGCGAAGRVVTFYIRTQEMTPTVAWDNGQLWELPLRPLTLPAAPTASFTASPTSGLAPLGVQFTDTSSGTVESWLWTFGDSVTHTHQHPTHTYTAKRAYTVTLTVSGAGGVDMEIKPAYIVVEGMYSAYLPLALKE